uniref:Uncharacterized protein n=1 Tax=Molossus molossus TaxID=27622 RepID=A0A7J8DBY7_MOLMO|nr:hypothetical protein HJG59_009369 [Molossus molossus]
MVTFRPPVFPARGGQEPQTRYCLSPASQEKRGVAFHQALQASGGIWPVNTSCASLSGMTRRPCPRTIACHRRRERHYLCAADQAESQNPAPCDSRGVAERTEAQSPQAKLWTAEQLRDTSS